MKIKYNAVSANAKTEIQWNKLGYKVKENVSGTCAWSNAYCVVMAVYYEPDEVEEMTYEDKLLYKLYLKEKKERNEQERKEERERIEKHHEYMEQMREDYNTACQWLELGYVVKAGSKPTLGKELQDEDECYFGSNYYYYHRNDVENNPTRAKELSENFPEGCYYDGRAWW